MADLHQKHAQELRDLWQGRALAVTLGVPMGFVVQSVLANAWPDAIETLFHAVVPGFAGLKEGFVTPARVVKTGDVCADFQTRSGPIIKNMVVYSSTADLQSAFRRLADRLKLSDDDRRELFIAVRKWVVADHRLDPTMNPLDPEAKRLVLH